MSIKIANFHSIGKTKNLRIKFDDRQTQTPVIGGNAVEDYGFVESGTIVVCSATFKADDYESLLQLWKNRTRVKVVLDDNTVIDNARIIVRSVEYFDVKMTSYKNVEIEVWKI